MLSALCCTAVIEVQDGPPLSRTYTYHLGMSHWLPHIRHFAFSPYHTQQQTYTMLWHDHIVIKTRTHFSFIWRYMPASKHCKCVHEVDLLSVGVCWAHAWEARRVEDFHRLCRYAVLKRQDTTPSHSEITWFLAHAWTHILSYINWRHSVWLHWYPR